MMYERKKDYFSFSEPALYRIRATYTTFDSQSEEQEQ